VFAALSADAQGNALQMAVSAALTSDAQRNAFQMAEQEWNIWAV